MTRPTRPDGVPDGGTSTGKGPDLASGAAFFVGRRPQMSWAWDMPERQLEFLRGIDARYFEHVAVSQGALLESDQRQYAAAAIRVAYGQSLETLMAFIGAAVQAPHSTLGWMLSYKNEDLRTVIKDLVGTPPTLDYLHPWIGSEPLKSLAEQMLALTDQDADGKDRLARVFARVWSRWCTEFLDPNEAFEYNSLKHGTRARLGGFELFIGPEHQPGVPADLTNMRMFGSSEFGSTFFVAEKLSGALHHYPRKHSRIWSPDSLAYGLQLMAISINNVVAILRLMNDDDPRDCEFRVPQDEEAFDLPWRSTSGVRSMSLDLKLTLENIDAIPSKELESQLRASRASYIREDRAEEV